MSEETKTEYPAILPVKQEKEAVVSPSEPRKSDEPTVTTPEYTEKPPSLQENYYIKMFEVGEAANHFEMPTLLKEINEFVLSEFERQKLDDTSENYKEVVNHYLDKLKLPENIDQYARAEKIHELMMIDKKLIEAMIAKEELLKKPIEELTSKQLRERIEGK